MTTPRADAHSTVLPAGKERGSSADLPHTARRILDASKRLLEENGAPGLTFDAIARESGANKSMIRYYFGSKDGLFAALVDDLTHDATTGLLDMARRSQATDEGLQAHLRATRTLMEDPSFKSLFDVFPEAMRREHLRARLADLYEWYREVNVICFGGSSADGDAGLRALACLFMACIDGLAMQVVLDEEHVDLDACWSLLGWMIETYIASRTGKAGPTPVMP